MLDYTTGKKLDEIQTTLNAIIDILLQPNKYRTPKEEDQYEDETEEQLINTKTEIKKKTQQE